MKINELTIMFNHHREPNSLDFILNKIFKKKYNDIKKIIQIK